jgi:hypothetical protein
LILLKYCCLPVTALSEDHPVLDRPNGANDFASNYPPAKQRGQVPAFQDDKKGGSANRYPEGPPGHVQGKNRHGEQTACVDEKKLG